MSPVSSSMPSDFSMLSDPFIYRLSQMCLKDPVVQSLYHGRLSWADIPSDDEPLELDDWESYNKVRNYAKTSYQQVYNARQRREQMRSTTKKQNNRSRTPYLTLKQNRFGPLRCESPVSISPAEMVAVTLPTVELPVAEISAEKLPPVQQTTVQPVEELPTVQQTIEEPSIEEPSIEEPSIEEPSIEELTTVELPVAEISIEELPTVQQPIEEPLEEIPVKKTFHIKKMSFHEKKYKEKEKQIAKKIQTVVPLPPRKKRFSFSAFFINFLVFSFIISSLMAGILVIM